MMMALVSIWLSGSPAEAHVYKVQLASYHREDQAWARWNELKRTHAVLLEDLTPSIERADLGRQRGVFFRLQAGAFTDSAQAESLCAQIHSKGLDCIVVLSPGGNVNRSVPSSPPIVAASTSKNDSETGNGIGKQSLARVDGVRTVAAHDDEPPPPASDTTGEALDSSEGSAGLAVDHQEIPAPPASNPEIPTLGNIPTEPAGYVRLLGGLTFVPSTDGFVGGGAGFNLTPTFQVVAEVGRFRDVLSRDLSHEALTESGELNRTRSAVYGMGGLRFLVPTSRYGRPYATVSAGIAGLRDDVSITVAGRDVTAEFRVVGALPPVAAKDYESLISLEGGVNWETKRGLSFDVGYRYVRIFTVEPIEVGAAYFAFGYVFKKSIDN